MDGAKYEEILEENVEGEAGAEAHFPSAQHPKHTTRATIQEFRLKYINVLEWTSQS